MTDSIQEEPVRTEKNADNKMANTPVFRLLLTMALPMMLSMMIQALYNIVDSIFIGRLANRAEALQALGYAYPIQMLLVSAGIGIGIGVNALLSRALGQNDKKTTAKAAGNGYFLMFLFYVVFLVFGILILTAGVYFNSCTGNPEVRRLGKAYLGICLVLSFGQLFQLIAERCLCATGKTNLAMIMQLAGALTNIVFDPVFIFAFKLGVVGAAIATVLGQCVSMALGFFFNIRFNREAAVTFKDLKPDSKILKEIFKVGLPAIVLQCLQSLTTLVMQLVFGILTKGDVKDLLVGIYGIYYKLQYFVLMLGYGLTNAVLPIIAFNYGSRNETRVKKTIFYALGFALVIAVLGIVVFECLPAQLLKCFNASAETTAGEFNEFSVGIRIIRITAPSFLFALVNILLACVLQALGNGVHSMIVALLRLLVILMPASVLFGKFGGIDNLWWGALVAETVAVIYAIFTTLLIYKKRVRSASDKTKPVEV